MEKFLAEKLLYMNRLEYPRPQKNCLKQLLRISASGSA